MHWKFVNQNALQKYLSHVVDFDIKIISLVCHCRASTVYLSELDVDTFSGQSCFFSSELISLDN